MKTKTLMDTKKKYDLDDSYDLVYVDYRDGIGDHKTIERLVNEGEYNAISDDSNDWISDSQWEGVKYVLGELKKDHPEMSEDDEEAIKEYLYERDTSAPIDDLLRHTPSEYFYYSLGISDPGMVQEGGEPDEKRVHAILKHLKLNDDKIRKVVKEVVNNAGYGGEIVMLFEDDIKDMMGEGTVIEFSPKAELCIMDRFNGSGYSAALGVPVVCEFNRANLHSDRGASGYSLTHDVCGMVKGFMGGATIRKRKRGDHRLKAKTDPEKQKQMEREKALEEKWRTTRKCTPGDMNWDRHIGPQTYINNYPCGNKCESCGTFWID